MFHTAALQAVFTTCMIRPDLSKPTITRGKLVIAITQAQLTKADFLAELRGKAASAPATAGRATKQRVAAAQGVSASEQAAAPDGPAWEALQDDDFAALSSGLKMKDWVSTIESRTDALNAYV